MSVIPTAFKRPVIALTPGEPAGIGPDLIALLDGDDSEVDWVYIADPELLAARSRLRGRPRRWPVYAPGVRGLSVLKVPLAYPARPGVLDVRNADYVLACLRRAAAGCLSGEFDALVTGPVHKAVINAGGHAFTGHTEFLAKEAQVSEVVMLLVAGSLRVALLTTHLALSAVPAAVTGERLDVALDILHRALVQDFGITTPHLVVLGLNPHAGEDGHLGREEIDVIAPAVARAQGRGLRVTGPVSADTAFVAGHLVGVDAILAMYHDQGLPVLKSQGFGSAVNVTLGLPFIRTSVDHGTALDRAGRGPIDTGSLVEAMALAKSLSLARVRS
ncbi:MAG TPA: 4-hydroxythreonine-4-phosphate dehydrogenase PdxA [Acidiferrobacter sp.]|nr:4-hydroxythreonine-4-phosphate dehydrogenase PdxA [Acidiferrobacter sp.]